MIILIVHGTDLALKTALRTAQSVRWRFVAVAYKILLLPAVRPLMLR
jgi:hypothetical protein